MTDRQYICFRTKPEATADEIRIFIEKLREEGLKVSREGFAFCKTGFYLYAVGTKEQCFRGYRLALQPDSIAELNEEADECEGDAADDSSWLAYKAMDEYLDAHSESINYCLRSRKKYSAFIRSLLNVLLKNYFIRQEFIRSGGIGVKFYVDADGMISESEPESD